MARISNNGAADAAPTRRALLGGAGLVGVVAAAPAIATATGASSGISPAFTKLCARFHAAKDATARAGKAMNADEGEAIRRVEQMRPAPIAPSAGPLDPSLSLNAIIGQTKTPEWKARWAAYERDLAVWTQERRAIEDAVSGASETAWEAALSDETDIVCAIRNYPVTTLAELNQKAAILREQYGDQQEAHDALALMRDIARLAELAA